MYLFVTKVHGDRQVKNAVSLVPISGEGYSSAFRYDEEMLEYINEHDTVSGFNGRIYGEWFILDVDISSLDIPKLITNIRPLLDYLKKNKVVHKIFFSGKKKICLTIEKWSHVYCPY